jgi:hypothetical protein
MHYSGISVDDAIAVSRLGEDAKLEAFLEAFFDTGTVPEMYIPSFGWQLFSLVY